MLRKNRKKRTDKNYTFGPSVRAENSVYKYFKIVGKHHLQHQKKKYFYDPQDAHPNGTK
jgi:hypothetical protein